MGWQLHLSTQPVSAVQFVAGDSPLVAVWDSKHNVHFYNQYDATPYGEQKFSEKHVPADLADEFWQEFAASLRAPNGEPLPSVFMAGLNLYQSLDGRMRLYHFQDGGLVLDLDGRYVDFAQDGESRILLAGLDRILGLIGAVDEEGMLHIYQQHVSVGAYESGLTLGMDARLNLMMPDGLARILVSDGDRVLIIDSAGRVVHELMAHYAFGPVSISPNGQYIALGDIDDNVVRIYDSALRPTHQKHAIDLVASSRQVQLLASLPGRKSGLSALDITDKGVIAFALGGVICVTDIKNLDVLPQPRPLL